MNDADCIREWLARLRTERCLSPLTVNAFDESVQRFQTWLMHSAAARNKSGRLLDATREDIQRFLVATLRTVTGRSAQRHLSGVRSLCRYLASEGVIATDPTRGIKAPRHTKKLPKWLDEAQTAKLLKMAECADSFLAVRDALILHLLYGSGLRASEVCWICRSDIADDLSIVRVRGKGGIERLALLSKTTSGLLKRYLESPEGPRGEYLFPRCYHVGTYKGQRAGDTPISRHRVWQIVAAVAKAAGVSAHPHTLRHSAASHMTCNGADVSHVQAFLGHSSPETTMIYSHIDLSTQRRAFDQFHPRAFHRKGEIGDNRRTA